MHLKTELMNDYDTYINVARHRVLRFLKDDGRPSSFRDAVIVICSNLLDAIPNPAAIEDNLTHLNSMLAHLLQEECTRIGEYNSKDSDLVDNFHFIDTNRD